MGHRVGLVLGGGGARGFAHVGVLRALEEKDYELAAIAGCSTAAILGALRAAGYGSGRMRDLVDTTAFWRLLRLRFSRGLLDQAPIALWLRRHLPERFEDLDLPFGVVAVDVERGRVVHFTSGPLVPAVLASHAFPGMFRPVRHDGRVLVDGGILEEVPMALLREMTDAPAIAVETNVPRDQEVIHQKGTGLLSRVGGALRRTTKLPLRLTYKSSAISRAALVEHLYREHPPALVIRPPLGHEVKTYSFDRWSRCVEIGYREACRKLA